MKSSAAALQKALYEALKNDGELIETLGGEHVYDHVPPKTAFPYITLGETLTKDWSTASELGGEHFLNIQIWARESGRKRVLEIAGRIATRLDEQPLAVNGHRIVNLMLTEVLARNTDGFGSYLGTMRYRAVTEPVI
ncbi:MULTISPECIES: DUF3168 domain-containing protein [Ochrobactrum]|uniref:DUF3168 domain-containing protein n=1 Tax=Ochrobactrum chromiisoli TaxID=2993941 RepID=A0ABT3QK48_9HYPH|nr:DUF3168 domain-containing protein [Ochrobactrum chromiisoli]MCX2695993.1 DUF3168 domain-containing protein [Ochrobactrum chromiisoli]